MGAGLHAVRTAASVEDVDHDPERDTGRLVGGRVDAGTGPGRGAALRRAAEGRPLAVVRPSVPDKECAGWGTAWWLLGTPEADAIVAVDVPGLAWDKRDNAQGQNKLKENMRYTTEESE